MSLFKRLTWLVLGLSVASLIMRSIVSSVMLQNYIIQNMMLAYTVSPFFSKCALTTVQVLEFHQ